jgi:DNA-binding NarL/FixJ family response regulator
VNELPRGHAAVFRNVCFSSREVEILEMTAQGLTNPQIADRLQLTVHTVKFHLASVYRKLGVANRTEAAVAYLGALGHSGKKAV